MRLSGWILIIIAWASILGMAVFCFSRIFKKGTAGDSPREHMNKKETGDDYDE